MENKMTGQSSKPTTGARMMPSMPAASAKKTMPAPNMGGMKKTLPAQASAVAKKMALKSRLSN